MSSHKRPGSDETLGGRKRRVEFSFSSQLQESDDEELDDDELLEAGIGAQNPHIGLNNIDVGLNDVLNDNNIGNENNDVENNLHLNQEERDGFAIDMYRDDIPILDDDEEEVDNPTSFQRELHGLRRLYCKPLPSMNSCSVLERNKPNDKFIRTYSDIDSVYVISSCLLKVLHRIMNQNSVSNFTTKIESRNNESNSRVVIQVIPREHRDENITMFQPVDKKTSKKITSVRLHRFPNIQICKIQYKESKYILCFTRI